MQLAASASRDVTVAHSRWYASEWCWFDGGCTSQTNAWTPATPALYCCLLSARISKAFADTCVEMHLVASKRRPHPNWPFFDF